MAVLDASLLVDALVGAGRRGDAALARLAAERVWHAPHLLPVEVMSAVRGLVLGGHVDQAVAARAVDRLRALDLTLHPLEPFCERVWELRANATVYDAWYLALAERLDVPLVTADPKLASIPGIACAVEVVASPSA